MDRADYPNLGPTVDKFRHIENTTDAECKSYGQVVLKRIRQLQVSETWADIRKQGNSKLAQEYRARLYKRWLKAKQDT